MKERYEPVWIPYSTPPQSKRERLAGVVRRYGFSVLCLVLLVLAGALLFHYSARPAGPPSEEELALLAEQLAARTEGQRIYEGEATLTIATLPADAVVYIDQEPSGISPLRRFSLSAGVHRITIQKEGYTSVDSVVAVRSDRPEALYVPLMEAPARGEEPPRQATAQLQSVLRQFVALCDLPHPVGELAVGPRAAALEVEPAHAEAVAARLPAGVLARDAVEPPLGAAGEGKVVLVHREDQALVHDAFPEPLA